MSAAPRSVFAPLTPPGRGGIAVVRATGPAVAAALEACFRPAASPDNGKRGGSPYPPRDQPAASGSAVGAETHRATRGTRGHLPVGRLAYGHIRDAEGGVLDEIVLHWAGPDTWEVNCHGGPAAVGAVCDRLASLGLRPVDPDALLVAEGAGPVERSARRLLRSAATPLAARILLDQFTPGVCEESDDRTRGGSGNGKRGGSPYPPRTKATGSESAVGAEPHRAKCPSGALERTVARADEALAAGRAGEAAAAVDTLLEAWRTCGRYLADPPRLVIAGRPNVGKSTLLNRLAGRERAITHAEPGTTRDYVETVAALDGLPVVLVDTAGLRETLERIEREGVARARRQTSGADLVLYLLDAEAGATAEEADALARLAQRGGSRYPPRDEPAASESAVGAETHRATRVAAVRGHVERVLAVWNKADLAAGTLGAPAALAVSARTGEGLDGLRREVLSRLDYRAPPPRTAVPLTDEQAEGLGKAADALRAGRVDAAGRLLAAVVGTGRADRGPPGPTTS